MRIKKLYSINFRNYPSCELELPAMTNVFYGNNAQGKTNLLEAIFYSAFATSHRTSSEDELMSHGSQAMAVILDYESLTGSHQVKLKRYFQQRWHKEIFLDGGKVRPKDHYGAFNAVMFSPEDLQLVKGEPALRRRFFDMQIAQTDRIYYELLVKYNRVLQQRNKLLKEIREGEGSVQLLQPWNQEFAQLASSIVASRLRALGRLSELAGRIYGSLTGQQELLEIRYEFKANNGQLLYELEDYSPEFFLKLLAARQQVDILRGNTGIGPHRDDLLLLLNNRSLRSFGSQGQQRSGALALKLSQLEYVHREIGEYPVLLLDDVMSELDNSRRKQLLGFIDGRVQTFITVNDKELIPELPQNAYYRIANGVIGVAENDEQSMGENRRDCSEAF